MKKAFLLGLFALGGLSSRAQTIAARLDSLFTAPGNYESLNGSVLIAENGKVIYQRSFGFANVDKKADNSTRSSFNIASLTKTFTSTAILQLLEKGKLHLDDLYKKYFPSFPYPNISIRHLLTHTSGLTDLETYFRVLDSIPAKMFTDADIIPCIIHLHRALKFNPGDNFEYCNINYELLALLIEHISKMSYPEYIRRHIFQPAAMTHSYFAAYPPASDTTLITDYMYEHLYDVNFVPVDSIKNLRLKQLLVNLRSLMGDGNIISTEEDLLRYDEALYNNKLLSSHTLGLAFQPNQLNNHKDYNFLEGTKLGKAQYGLGWIINTDSSHGKIVFHGGHYPGIWNNFVRNIDKHQTIIIYDNTDWSGADLLSTMALEILNNEPISNVLSKRMLARIYGQTLMKQDADAALTKLLTLKQDTVHYILREQDMNMLGYQFMLNGHSLQSLETFKVNTLLFPSSANVYDSYGDALASAKKNEEAVMMYEKALILSPGNQDTKEKLAKIERLSSSK
jgi:CubicO group peptidase (beta-lactamase class C family)